MAAKIVVSLPPTLQNSFAKIPVDALLEVGNESLEQIQGRRPFIVRMGEGCTQRKIDTAMSYSPEYVDIPSHADKELFRYCREKGVQTIASYHNTTETPSALDAIFDTLLLLKPTVIKIVTYARSSTDALRLLELLQRRGKECPSVIFAMGNEGRFSRLLQPLYNGLWTYACITKKEATAEGQYTYAALCEEFNFTRLSPRTRLFGCTKGGAAVVLLGNLFFSKAGMNALCVAISLKPKEKTEADFYMQALHITPISLREVLPLPESILSLFEQVAGPYVEVALPPSKSQTLRAILFAACATGQSTIHNVLLSPDTVTMIEACRALGAQVVQKGTDIRITGFGLNRETLHSPIHAGNSGIVLRFVAAVAAIFSTPCTITGDQSMKERRSCRELLQGLSCLGVDVSSYHDHVPITVAGPMQPGVTRLSGEDSQPVSALLIAAALLPGTTHIFVENSGEKPWVQLTLSWLKNMGVSIENEAYSHYIVHGEQEFLPFEYSVPGDLSSLGYIVVLALITHAAVTISNVDLKDPQGDKELLSILERMGAHIGYDEKDKVVRVQGKQTLTSNMSVDANNCIDMVTLLAVLGCFAEGQLTIYNCEVSKDKESNRLEAIVSELKKMGAFIEGDSEHLVVNTSKLHGAPLSSYHDHRVVMALKVAALGASVECTFDDTACVEKSFPSFFEIMDKINANNTDRISGGW